MEMNEKLKISERSMQYGTLFAKAWKGNDAAEVEYWFNLYVAERRKLPKEASDCRLGYKRFESALAYLATQGEFEG